MNKNIILVIAGVVIIYLLFVNKKVSETVRQIAQGVIPPGLTTSPRPETGTADLPTNSSGGGTTILVPATDANDLGADFNDNINPSGTFQLPY